MPMESQVGSRSLELAADELVRRCAPATLGFTTTAAADGPEAPFGHARAEAAIALAAQVGSHGHNVYVMGLPGSGRHAAAQRLVGDQAQRRPVPGDWCYLNDFEDPRRPRAVHLPAGRASALRRDMRQLVAELRVAVPAAFESEGYRNRRREIDHEFEERTRAALASLHEAAQRDGLGLLQTPQGFAIAPIRDGEVLSAEDFAKLPDIEQQRTREAIERVGELLRRHLEGLPGWAREQHLRIRELDRDVVRAAVAGPIAEVRARHADLPAVTEYLARAEADMLENAAELLRGEPGASLPAVLRQAGLALQSERYEVNVLVDNGVQSGAPVVYEGNPTCQNLVGRIENVAQFGALVTNFTMIRSGALHRANGGFLILDAERVLTQPFAWEALKRALSERSVRVESPGQMLSFISTVSLEPAPIPLELRVVLIGTRRVHQLLAALDPDFAELFRVVADFDDVVDRTETTERAFGAAVAALARRDGLRPLEAAAVARLVDHASRLAGDAAKLSTHLRSIEDVVRESDHLAASAGSAVVSAPYVRQALERQVERLARVHATLVDAVRRGTLLVDCAGSAVGQVNGLYVFQLGSTAFGQPVRITATARVGDGSVVDIEREAALGGPIHSKGVLILAGLVGARYGLREPLSLNARLVFEQSYALVDGDSASLAETCALLSAIAQLPLRQDVAVTGSVNQHGRVQAVGGVDEKIEGYYDVCRARGLTGTQGVLVPYANRGSLMLREEVVDAVTAGQFHVWAVASVDEALGLLSGVPAGERAADGAFPPRSFNAQVEERLQSFAHQRRRFAAEPGARRRYRHPKERP